MLPIQNDLITPRDIYDIIKRRIWCLIIPVLVVTSVAAIVALALPSIYKSTSTILIEQQNIPTDFVMSAVTSYAEQRIQTINQRIMSSTKLLEIINSFDLYKDLRGSIGTEEIISRMRKSVTLTPISAEVVDKRGRPTTATIAFTLSYSGKIPTEVQKVTTVLTSLFLKENLQVRERQAKETSKFLQDEVNRMKAQLNRIVAEIAEYKKQYVNELPELFQVNMQSLNHIEMTINRMNEDYRAMKEREMYIRSELANTSPTLNRRNEDEQRLKELIVQLTFLTTRFSDEYPDVIKTRAEIAELEDRLKNSIPLEDDPVERPDNPSYVTLSVRLASTEAELEAYTRRLDELNRLRKEYQDRIASTPKVEEALNAILVERATTQGKYDDLMRKLMESNVSEMLEKEQKGERFMLIDPARLPEKPFKPNRMAILLIGVVLGLGMGVGLIAAFEFFDDSVGDAEMLSRAFGMPVLVTIPVILTARDKIRKRLKLLAFAFFLLSLVIVGMVVFHYMVMDLNVFWAKVMRKLGPLLPFLEK